LCLITHPLNIFPHETLQVYYSRALIGGVVVPCIPEDGGGRDRRRRRRRRRRRGIC